MNKLVVRLSPILKLKHAFLPPKCYELGNEPELVLLLLFSPLDSQLNPSRSLGVCHYHMYTKSSHSVTIFIAFKN